MELLVTAQNVTLLLDIAAVHASHKVSVQKKYMTWPLIHFHGGTNTALVMILKLELLIVKPQV